MPNNDCTLTSVTKPTQAADAGSPGLPHTPSVDFGNAVCLGAKPVLYATEGQDVIFNLVLRDRSGSAIDLTPLQGLIDTSPVGSSSSSSSGGPLLYTVRFMAEERPDSHVLVIDVVGTITDYANGVIQIELSKCDTVRPGIFFAQVVIFDSNGALIQATPYWLCIQHSVHINSHGPISIAEIRLLLRDVCPDQNFLLDDVEFADDEIAYCIVRPVDEFNETFQPKTMFTASNFPFRYNWANAAAGYLMRMAATSYARNYLDYNASGAQINLQNKTKLYNELSNQLLSEWRAFVKNTKLEINISQSWGTQRSAYIRGWW